LLFGTVAHHAGMRLGGFFAGTFGIWLVGHFEISGRGYA
jgi:hypothetical protein